MIKSIIDYKVPRVLTESELKAEVRDIKLSMILDNYKEFEIDLKKLRKGNNRFFNKGYWSILKEWKGKAIITGSLALYAFGLIDRLPADIDLIVDKNSFIPPKTLSSHNEYGPEPKLNILGYYTQKWYNVDFFHLDERNFIEKDGFLFHNPFDIMEKKIELIGSRYGNHKDYRDIIFILNKIKINCKNNI